MKFFKRHFIHEIKTKVVRNNNWNSALYKLFMKQAAPFMLYTFLSFWLEKLIIKDVLALSFIIKCTSYNIFPQYFRI